MWYRTAYYTAHTITILSDSNVLSFLCHLPQNKHKLKLKHKDEQKHNNDNDRTYSAHYIYYIRYVLCLIKFSPFHFSAKILWQNEYGAIQLFKLCVSVECAPTLCGINWHKVENPHQVYKTDQMNYVMRFTIIVFSSSFLFRVHCVCAFFPHIFIQPVSISHAHASRSHLPRIYASSLFSKCKMLHHI